jgi:hypothetical protein
VQVAQDLGVGFKLGRKEFSQRGKSCGRGSVWIAGVGGFVVDDPPCLPAFGLRLESGSEDAVYANDVNGAETASDDSHPSDLTLGIRVG